MSGRLIRVAMMLLVAVVALCGCDNQPSPLGIGGTVQSGYAARDLPGATSEQVYKALLAEMDGRFTVTLSDAAGMNVQARPAYLAAGPGQTGQLRVISSPSERRVVASSRVRSLGGVPRAEVQVLLQRRDTAQHAAYRSMIDPGDAPRETPIDRGAMLGPEHQEVWTTYNRDYSMEREILDAAAARLGAASPAAPAAVAPPPPAAGSSDK